MKVEEINSIAKQMGIPVGKLKKIELIKLIQRSEGNFDCFGTPDNGICSQSDCLWRDDCLSLK